jgi:hypothetical protein
MKLIARCPRERVREEELAGIAAQLEADRATGYELAPPVAPDLTPGADGTATAPAGLLMAWLPGAAPGPEVGSIDALEVREENVILDTGAPTAVARIGFLRRRPDLTHQEFADHWLRIHTRLVLEHDPLFARYVANLLDPASGWDGVVEQHFADRETWAEHDRRIVTERPAVREDIPKMLDSMEQFAATPVARFAAPDREEAADGGA